MSAAETVWMPSARAIAAEKATRRLLADPLTFLASAGITPDPWQAEVLTCSDQQVLLNCSRQSGKTLVTAALAIYAALTQPSSKVLIVSKAQRQAYSLLRAAHDIYRDSGRPIAPQKEDLGELRLANRSVIYALPGSSETIRGLSALDLLVIDEAAFVPDELYLSVRPMLATRAGRIVVLSSPYGKRGWYWDAWHACELAALRGEAEPWKRFRVPASLCPRITPEWLESERREMGLWWFTQEYGCEFLDALTMPFATADVEAAQQPAVEAWDLPALEVAGWS
jgi:hypothetical protein